MVAAIRKNREHTLLVKFVLNIPLSSSGYACSISPLLDNIHWLIISLVDLWQHCLLQVTQRQLMQPITILRAKLERIREDIDRLDPGAPLPLLIKPLWMESYSDDNVVLSLAVCIGVAHLERLDRSFLELDVGDELLHAAFLSGLLVVAIIVETPRESGRVIGDAGCVAYASLLFAVLR